MIKAYFKKQSNVNLPPLSKTSTLNKTVADFSQFIDAIINLGDTKFKGGNNRCYNGTASDLQPLLPVADLEKFHYF